MSPRSFAVLAFVLVACNRAPEIVGQDPSGGGAPKPGGAGAAPGAPPPAAPAPVSTPAEPVKGPIALKDATAGLAGTGALYADIDTDQGKLSCKLFEDKAPLAVANFVALSRGLQPFKDPMSGKWVKRPAYDGTSFHRIVKGFMIQGGDPSGTGTGDPGYVFNDEVHGMQHNKAGLLCMANKGPNTNGMQFFVMDGVASHLDSGYTIFGDCAPEATVHKIAALPVSGETPINKPRITKVTIRRE